VIALAACADTGLETKPKLRPAMSAPNQPVGEGSDSSRERRAGSEGKPARTQRRSVLNFAEWRMAKSETKGASLGPLAIREGFNRPREPSRSAVARPEGREVADTRHDLGLHELSRNPREYSPLAHRIREPPARKRPLRVEFVPPALEGSVDHLLKGAGVVVVSPKHAEDLELLCEPSVARLGADVGARESATREFLPHQRTMSHIT